MKNFTLFLLLIMLSFFACETKTEDPDSSFLGYDYYPVEIGNEWTYKLDSFLYSNDGAYKDTATWYVKEKITDLHEVGEEENNYVLERSLSEDNINWKVSDIWTMKKGASNIQKTEENHTFIKLIFPPTIGKSWDGNAFLDEQDTVFVYGENFKMFENWNYKILENSDEYNVGSSVYNDVLRVREVYDSSAIDIKSSYAYYSRGVGLVLEERRVLFDQSNDTSKDWALRAQKGFILRKELLSYETN